VSFSLYNSLSFLSAVWDHTAGRVEESARGKGRSGMEKLRVEGRRQVWLKLTLWGGVDVEGKVNTFQRNVNFCGLEK
jgi:hypothetical protein